MFLFTITLYNPATIEAATSETSQPHRQCRTPHIHSVASENSFLTVWSALHLKSSSLMIGVFFPRYLCSARFFRIFFAAKWEYPARSLTYACLLTPPSLNEVIRDLKLAIDRWKLRFGEKIFVRGEYKNRRFYIGEHWERQVSRPVGYVTNQYATLTRINRRFSKLSSL